MARPDDDSFEKQPEARELLDEESAIEAAPEPGQFRVLRRIFENEDNYVVVSFGGGALPGITGNLALARLLEELDLKQHVREVWGCSAGAIVAGPWASGVNHRIILDVVKSLESPGPVSVNRKALFKGVIGALLRKKPLPDGLLSADTTRIAIRDGLRRHSCELLEECPIPARLVAVSDDGHARRVVFREGPIVNAIMASMCIPGVMEPEPSWTGEPYGYLDGGIVEKTPLVSVIDEYHRHGEARRLVVLCSHYTDAGRISVPRGFLARLLHTFDRMEDMMWENQLAEARRDENVRTIVVSPNIRFGGMFDIKAMDFNLLWSRREFKRQLSNAGLAGRFDAR